MPETILRTDIAEPAQGMDRIRWYGPGLLWMISSVGSGAILFTPRVGSRYGYVLLWAAVIVLLFMWTMIREIGRYTVVTGRTFLDGCRNLAGPPGWAIWLIFIPQLAAAVVTIAGIAALMGSVLMIAFPGSQTWYGIGAILLSALLVVTGRFKQVQRASSIMALMLVVAAVVTAFAVSPSPSALASGLIPSIPEQLDVYFILPWLGFLLAGAAGIMWYSYWVSARGYGTGEGRSASHSSAKKSRTEWFHEWIDIMSTTAAIGVIGGGLIIGSFLILGTELLRPKDIMPEGIRVAEDLTRLLSEVWGTWGFWILVLGMAVALWGTILADQDGWGRLFADATALLLPTGNGGSTTMTKWLTDSERLKDMYVLLIVTALPICLFILIRDPVRLLSAAGIIAAIHTPVVALITLYLNRTQLPRELGPGLISSSLMIMASSFFGMFAVLYLLNMVGLRVI